MTTWIVLYSHPAWRNAHAREWAGAFRTESDAREFYRLTLKPMGYILRGVRPTEAPPREQP